MKRKAYSFLFFVLSIVLSFYFFGCRTYQYKIPSVKNSVRVNPLVPYVKLPNLPQNYLYSDNPKKEIVIATRPKAKELLGVNYQFVNAVEMFGMDVLKNVCFIDLDSIDYLDFDKIGTAELTITKFKKGRNPLIFLLSITKLALYVPQIVGIPAGSRTAKIELSMDVKDHAGNVIKTYTASAKHTAVIAVWWGYSSTAAVDVAHDNAFTEALASIRKQMEADAEFLNSKLDRALLSKEQVKAIKYFEQAEAHYKKEEYRAAADDYEMGTKQQVTYRKEDAKYLYHYGYSLLVADNSKEGDLQKAIDGLLLSWSLDSALDAMVPIALISAYRSKGDDETALKWASVAKNKFTLEEKRKKLVDDWKTDSEIRLAQTNAGKELLKTPVDVKIANLGTTINTINEDNFPSLAADESILYFTSRREGSTGKLSDGKYDEDLWYSVRQSDSTWGKPQNMGTPVNTDNNNGIASITGDGQYVICVRCGEKTGFGSCDIYGATLKGNTWSEPKNLGPVINTKEWDCQASISVDGKTLVWATQREGGKGKQDLWMSKKDTNGVWQAPVNLGDKINTAGSEYSPFLSPDCKTLYFASEFLSPRIGGIDIYKSTLQDDGTWGTPENMGYPINTVADDYHFILSPSGLSGYFASTREGGVGDVDIYSIKFPDKNKSALITFVGFVFDEETKVPIEASITINDLETNEQVGTYTSNAVTGKFIVVLIPGRNYSLNIDKQSYLFYSENFDIPKDNEFKEIEKQVFMQKVKVGKKIVLNNIFFDKGLSTLRMESFSEIDKLVKLMTDNPQIVIEIGGHTDNTGDDAINTKISKDRAQVVVDALASKGIATTRMKSIGYGSKMPIVENDTEENKQLNRRTEFKILQE